MSFVTTTSAGPCPRAAISRRSPLVGTAHVRREVRSHDPAPPPAAAKELPMTIKKTVARAAACGVLAVTALTTACTPEEQSAFIAHVARQEAAIASTRSMSSLSDAQLARLASCESGGNPAAVSKSGKYHGLYQFNQTTWNGVAKSVLPEYVGVKPSKAPSHVQDAMARALHASRGRSPWPVCGKRI